MKIFCSVSMDNIFIFINDLIFSAGEPKANKQARHQHHQQKQGSGSGWLPRKSWWLWWWICSTCPTWIWVGFITGKLWNALVEPCSFSHHHFIVVNISSLSWFTLPSTVIRKLACCLGRCKCHFHFLVQFD